MRTLLLAPALFASEGGIERMMRLYLKALCDTAAPGDIIDVAALNDHEQGDTRMAAYSSPALRQQIHGKRRRLPFAVAVLRTARRCDRLVCGHVNLLPLAAWAQRINPRLRTHLIAHGIEVWKPWRPPQRRALRLGARVIAVSEYTRQRVLGRCPELDPTRTCVVPNALDPNLPAPGPVGRTPGLIVTLSRLSATDSYKGVDHLIEALPEIRSRQPQARLLVIGDGDDRPRLERLAAERAPGTVEFTGYLPDGAARSRLATASLFALPSRDEGFGLVYLEALALGLPCIAARAGGAPEVVNDAVGALVDYGDVRALAAACTNALARTWVSAELERHAARFAYPVFCDKLSMALGRAS